MTDPLERQRQKLSGELDSEEARRQKIAAHQARLAKTAKFRRLKAQKVPENARRMVDPIEARKKKMTESMVRRRETSRKKSLELPKHLVVVVKALANPPKRPSKKKAPPPAKLEDPEDEITRRLREARERLKGL